MTAAIGYASAACPSDRNARGSSSSSSMRTIAAYSSSCSMTTQPHVAARRRGRRRRCRRCSRSRRATPRRPATARPRAGQHAAKYVTAAPRRDRRRLRQLGGPRVRLADPDSLDDRVEHLVGIGVDVVEDLFHLVLGEVEVGEQVEVADRPHLVELVVLGRFLAEPGHHLLGQRVLDRRGQVRQQQRDARAVQPGDQEELVVDAGDDERTALGRLRAQRLQQHAEVAEHGRWQRLDAPQPAVADTPRPRSLAAPS